MRFWQQYAHLILIIYNNNDDELNKFHEVKSLEIKEKQ